MILLNRGWRVFATFLIFFSACGASYAQPALEVAAPTFSDGIAFVTKTFDHYPVVAIADLPGCDELHSFIRDLVRSPDFSRKVHTIIVDFGNPAYQELVDRYLLNGELVPQSLLRHVWDDTTESPNLTWDSPVYAEFFDTIHAINLSLPREQRVRVILADAPISWRHIRSRQEWLAIRGELREKALAAKISAALQLHERVLVISSASYLYRNSDVLPNTRALVEREWPDKIFVVLPQVRFGASDSYQEVERHEEDTLIDSIATIHGTWLGLLTLSAAPDAPRLQDVADAILYLGKTDRLTRIQPSALAFRDEQFWMELNARWKLVHGTSFSLANAGFDLRGPYLWPPPQIHFPSVSGLKAEDPVNFVLEKLKDYPLVGIGDRHMCLEYFQFINHLIRDPRLPGNVQDIVVEFGNPRYQSVIDRYVFEGKSVPLAQRKKVWQYAIMGWYVASSPIYEGFYDELHSVNAKLPKNKRIRVILGDAPFDVARFRADPDRSLRPFLIHKETAQDPREISIAASLIRVLAAGHRAIVLSGNGHLDLTQRTGNARHLLERACPNKFFLIDENGPGAPSWPVPSVVTQTHDPEPNYATLWLGRPDRLTIVRPSPLIYRDTKYWAYIDLMTEVESHTPLDLASPNLEYRSRLFTSDRGSN